MDDSKDLEDVPPRPDQFCLSTVYNEGPRKILRMFWLAIITNNKRPIGLNDHLSSIYPIHKLVMESMHLIN